MSSHAIIPKIIIFNKYEKCECSQRSDASRDDAYNISNSLVVILKKKIEYSIIFVIYFIK